MALTKDTRRVRINGGNDMQIYFGGAWKPLGNALEGTFSDKTDATEITFADGDTIDLDGKRKVSLSVSLAQTSKEELDLVDILREGLYPVFYDNGIINTGGVTKRQYIYIPAFNYIPDLELKAPDTPMKMLFMGTATKQSVPVQVIIGTTVLPSSSLEDTTPTTITSGNNYYCVFEQTIS